MTKSLLTALHPVHPGEVLREDVLPAVTKPRAEVARLLKVSRQTLYDILNERQPVTVQMALRLARMFGGSAGTWLRLKQNYDLAMVSAAIVDELAIIPQLQAA